jgi:2-aminoadipate transaminase
MQSLKSPHHLFSRRSQNMPSSFLRDILKVANQKGIISFAGGFPDPGLFPLQELEKCAADVFREHSHSLLQYSNSEGLLSLKEWICSYYQRYFQLEVKPEQLLITSGSQQGLDLIGKAFLDPSDQLILEQPSYLGAIQAFMAYEPEILPLPSHSDGPDIAALEQLLQNHSPKMLYLVSNFQNPTGFTISAEKRIQLAQLAEKHGFIIVEDDPYGQLRFEGEHLMPIRTYTGNSILCGSFSKMIAPGLRIGWILSDEPIIQKLLILKQATDLHSNNLSQYIANHFLRNCAFEDHLNQIRSHYADKCNCMYEAIAASFPPECIFSKPEGGMFIWVELPDHMDAERILKSCLQKNVIFVPGKYFYTNGKGTNTMRLNFTNSSEENIRRGIAMMGQAISDCYGTVEATFEAELREE